MSAQAEILFYKSQVEADKAFLGFYNGAIEGLPQTTSPLTGQPWGVDVVRSDRHWILLALLDNTGVPKHRVLPTLYRFLRRVTDENIRDAIWDAIDVTEYYSNQDRWHKINREVENMTLSYSLAWISNFWQYKPADAARGSRDLIFWAAGMPTGVSF